VKAGEVKIYPTGNGLRFYKVEFTYTTSGAASAVEYDWDFAASDWQEQFAALGAVNTDIATADFTYDGLRVFWSSKCKYNTTFLQWGGKSSGEDRFVSFTAPDQGTVKVWASNTGNSEDLTVPARRLRQRRRCRGGRVQREGRRGEDLSDRKRPALLPHLLHEQIACPSKGAGGDTPTLFQI